MPLASGLYYEIHGPVDAEPLILSAGLGGSGHYWAPNMQALTTHFRVIVYDHRGTGRSERSLPETHRRDENMAPDVIALMDEIGIASAHFIGHAAGAMIGLGIAREWPDRLRSLVLVNGWEQPDPHFVRCFETRLALLRGAGVPAYVRAQPLFLYPANWISDNLAMLDEEARGHIVQFPPIAVLERRIAALRAVDFTGQLGAQPFPVLVLCADDDMLVPSHCSDGLAAAIPGSVLVRMPWGGHACNVTDPDSFNAITLDFLRS